MVSEGYGPPLIKSNEDMSIYPEGTNQHLNVQSPQGALFVVLQTERSEFTMRLFVLLLLFRLAEADDIRWELDARLKQMNISLEERLSNLEAG